MIKLARQVLDQQVLDRKDDPIGKVDGVVLGFHEGAPPTVIGIELGGSVLARRIHPSLATLANAVCRLIGMQETNVTRINWDRVRKIGLHVVVDVDPKSLPVHAWEDWLKRHVVEKIPGGADDGDPERHHQ